MDFLQWQGWICLAVAVQVGERVPRRFRVLPGRQRLSGWSCSNLAEADSLIRAAKAPCQSHAERVRLWQPAMEVWSAGRLMLH